MKGAVFVFISWCFFVAPVLAEDPVYFADPRLKAAVEDDLWISDPTPTDMLGLTSLSCVPDWNNTENGIENLTGLEYALNLRTLNLRLNHISNISPVSGLTNLRNINLSENQISDISPLSGLSDLEYVNLHENQISNISALSGLVNVETLILRFNEISDLSAVASMPLLKELDLGGNQVSSLSAVSGLTQLSKLSLWRNQITSVAPLAGLTNLRMLDLDMNRVQSISSLSGLYDLEDLDLQSNQVSDVSPLSDLMDLKNLDLGDNQISNISALCNLTNLKTLDLTCNFSLNQEAYCSHLAQIHSHGTTVVYSPNNDPPMGVLASDDLYQDKVAITWNSVCNGPAYTSHYRVFRARAISDPKVPLSDWQTSCSFDDTTAKPGTHYYYWLKTAVSDQGLSAGNYSEPAEGLRRQGHSLFVSSTAGGSVTAPGEGPQAYVTREIVTVEAKPIDSGLYVFAGWTGTAVDTGKVADCSAARTTVTVDGSYTLKAHFVTTLATLYVDGSVSDDSGSGDVAVSDAQENGTQEHPFDTIQEAIEVSVDGTSIVVRPGTYCENIDFQGKSIELVGMGEASPNGGVFPIIDGGNAGTVLTFTQREDPNCMVLGFVLTRGRGQLGGAILCSGSRPTIANCLIVGNRTTDPNGAAIYCTDSQTAFVNCTIGDNGGDAQRTGLRVVGSDVTVVNSILWDNGTSEILLSEASELAITHTDVTGGWPGLGNMDGDPLFVRRGYWADPDDPSIALEPSSLKAVWIAGDYHLKSQAGRWEPETQTWIQDEVTSPCIDAGDLLEAVGQEPVPNGGTINMGVYGGTTNASRSY